MHDLWLRVCSLLDVDPTTVVMPSLKVASPQVIELFGGGSFMYHPGDNSILMGEEMNRGKLAHEFAHAVCWQSPDYDDGDNEARCRWVEANI